jgi:hypothetical protein
MTAAGAVGPDPHDPFRSRIPKDLVGDHPSRFRLCHLAVTAQKETHPGCHQHGGDDPDTEKGEEDHPGGRGPMMTAVP